MAIDLGVSGIGPCRPKQGSADWPGQSPSLLPSLGWLLVLRVPVAFLEMLLTFWSVLPDVSAVVGMEGPVWGLLAQRLPPEVSLEDIRGLLQALPPAPSLAKVLPWLLLAAPVVCAQSLAPRRGVGSRLSLAAGGTEGRAGFQDDPRSRNPKPCRWACSGRSSLR